MNSICADSIGHQNWDIGVWMAANTGKANMATKGGQNGRVNSGSGRNGANCFKKIGLAIGWQGNKQFHWWSVSRPSKQILGAGNCEKCGGSHLRDGISKI